MLILVLAAIAYADSTPRVHSGPRPLRAPAVHEPGRSAGVPNGIVGLSALAAVLLVVFGGDTHR
jgi:hypothetical protein